jgi:Uma2 family endonuclease
MISYDEFLRRDWLNPHVEWVRGEVVEMPPIGDVHADLNDLLRAVVRIFVERRKLGIVRSDPFNMKLGPDLSGRAPDLMFIAKSHQRRVRKTHLEGPADLVIEIISPGSRGVDRGDKFYEYEQGGVPEYWLIDPERRVAEFYRLAGRGKERRYRAMTVDDDGTFGSAILQPFWMNVNWLWQRPLPEVLEVLSKIDAD